MKITIPPQIDSISLTERVYKDLRAAILTGDIPNGTRLIEATLAEQMGVSRTPVREALQRFSQEGLIYAIPRAGYVVEDRSDEDVQDLFETRTAIEQIVVRWALGKITDEELDHLKLNLDKTDEVIKSGRTEKMIDLDIEFHHIIYKACRSKRLYQISKTLSDHTLKYRIACIHVPEIARRAREDHQKIYEAIQSRDSEATVRAVSDHLMVVKDDILNFIKEKREKQFIGQPLG